MIIRFLLSVLLAGCSLGNTDFPGQSFLGARYLNSPLGEGIAPDNDPLIRFDAFDCTTFVETVISDNNLKKLNKIRYKNGQVDFLARNHFIETDWLQNNSDVVQNVSNRYGPVQVRSVKIDKKSWFKKVHNIETEFTPQVVDIEYIPYKNAKNILPEKTLVVLFITDKPELRDKIGTDLAVVHMGLLLPNGMLRHASSTQGKVVDVDMDEYIDNRTQDKTNLGITLVEIK